MFVYFDSRSISCYPSFYRCCIIFELLLLPVPCNGKLRNIACIFHLIHFGSVPVPANVLPLFGAVTVASGNAFDIILLSTVLLTVT